MQDATKKFIRNSWTWVTALVSFLLSFFSDEIKSSLSRANIVFPPFDIVTAIFAAGMIVGSVAFAVQMILGLRKSTKGIKFFHSREELPSLREILSKADKEISFLGVSLEKVIGQETSTITDAIERGVHVKFLLLNNESELISRWDESMICGTKNAITSSLARLCKIKQDLKESNRNRCEIRTYDISPLHSMIVANSNSEDDVILVEFQIYKTEPKAKPNLLVYRKKQPLLFEKYLKSYQFVLDHSVEYQCRNKSEK